MKTKDNLLKQLEAHIELMGWDTHGDADYYARIILDIVESHSDVEFDLLRVARIHETKQQALTDYCNHVNAGVINANRQNMAVMTNDAEILFFHKDVIDSMRGCSFDSAYVFEEVGEDIINSVVVPSLIDTKGTLIIVGDN